MLTCGELFKRFLCSRYALFQKGLDDHGCDQEVRKVVSLVKNVGKSDRCIQSYSYLASSGFKLGSNK